MGERIVAHHQVSVLLAVQNLAQLVSVIAFEGTFGCILVQVAGFKDESQFFDRGSRSIIIDFSQRQFHVFRLCHYRSCSLLVEQHLFVTGNVDEIRVSATDDSCCLFVTGLTNDFYVKLFLDIFFQ